MIARALFPAALLAISPAARADGLSGWWMIESVDDTDTRYAPRLAFPFFTREQSRPDVCRLEGQLMMKEGKAKNADCTMALTHACGGQPARHLSVVQACTVTRDGDTITIKGSNAEIIDAAPPHVWTKTYPADTLILTLSPYTTTMTGSIARKAGMKLKVTKLADLVE